MDQGASRCSRRGTRLLAGLGLSLNLTANLASRDGVGTTLDRSSILLFDDGTASTVE